MWILATVYAIGSGLQDLSKRKIANWWNYSWIVAFVLYNTYIHAWFMSLSGFLLMGLGLLIPTIKGIYGAGDWKMGMALGSAVGPLLAPILFLCAYALILFLKKPVQKLSLRFLEEEDARMIPFGTFVMLGVLLFGGLRLTLMV